MGESRLAGPHPPRARGIRAISSGWPLGVEDFEKSVSFESHDEVELSKCDASFADFEILDHGDFVLQTARVDRLMD
jgi:hypothetical protein